MYEYLNALISYQLDKSNSSKPKPDVCDYNKIVGILHDDAFKDAQNSKQAKLEKLAKKKERKINKMRR